MYGIKSFGLDRTIDYRRSFVS